VVCTAAITAGGAVEAKKIVHEQRAPSRPAAAAVAAPPSPTRHSVTVPAPAPLRELARPRLPHGATAPAPRDRTAVPADAKPVEATPLIVDSATEPGVGTVDPSLGEEALPSSGGTAAPDDATQTPPADGATTGGSTPTTGDTTAAPPADGTATTDPGDGTGSNAPPADPSTSTGSPGAQASDGGGATPAPTH
jgi:hypothetical protein